MLNISKLGPRVLENLHERGHSDEAISRMSPAQAFDEYCEWEGLPGWGPVLRGALDNIRDAALKAGE